jgi:hypothetical protein
MNAITYDHMAWEPRILKHQAGWDDPFTKANAGKHELKDVYKTSAKVTVCKNIETGQVTTYPSSSALALEFGYVGVTAIMQKCMKDKTLFKGKYLIDNGGGNATDL